ncbi:MAG: hypothetical protein L0H74_05765, partial [Brachybacterium sp.]|nr:hypothetical protein [Brachybacterium sp.]
AADAQVSGLAAFDPYADADVEGLADGAASEDAAGNDDTADIDAVNGAADAADDADGEDPESSAAAAPEAQEHTVAPVPEHEAGETA